MPNDTHCLLPVAPDDADINELTQALRALPLVAPPHSVLAAVLAARPAIAQPVRRRQYAGMAWAAGVIAIGLGVAIFHARAPEVTVVNPPATANRLGVLMAQSAQWETTLRAFDDQAVPMNAGTALATAELEDLIGLTDLQLGATQSEAQAESLWKRRIGLISRLTEVRTRAAWQRANPEPDAGLLSANYPID